MFGLALERISEGVECVSNILCLNLRVKFGETVPFFKLAERTRAGKEKCPPDGKRNHKMLKINKKCFRL